VSTNHFLSLAEYNRESATSYAITCKGISKQYKKSGFRLDINDISFKAGEITGLVGENGNGKSTLLRILAGELAPDAGELLYPSIQDNPKKYDWLNIKSQVAYLPQELRGINGSVIDSLRLYAALHGRLGKDNDFEVDYIVTRLGLDDMVNARWAELSGGFKLKFALARLLVCKPKIMILDEPLANLDINAQNILLNDLKSLSQSIDNPLSIIISTQHLEVVESVADKMAILTHGKIVYSGLTTSIGLGRTENTFELRSPLSKTELIKKLEGFNYIKLESTGMSYIITTPAKVAINDLMQRCVDTNIEVKMICDMSNSTKKILLHTNTAA